MTQPVSEREIRVNAQAAAKPVFKPVALPAVAAAVQAAKLQPKRPKNRQLPAFLRKEAVLG
jgi:hypothetical protein